MEHLCSIYAGLESIYAAFMHTPVVIVQVQIDSGAHGSKHDTVWHCVAVRATAGRKMYPNTLKRLSKLNHFIRAAFL